MSGHQCASLPTGPVSLVENAAPREPAGHLSADEVFAGVDGRVISGGSVAWTVEVFGIRDVGRHRWIQVGLTSETETLMVTRRLVAGAGVQHVILTLSSWLARPAGTDELYGMLNVA